MTLPTNEDLRGRAEPDRETRRELAKLTATFLNGIAIAIFAVGALAPLVAIASGQLIVADARWAAFLSVVAFSLSLVGHVVARYLLGREFRR